MDFWQKTMTNAVSLRHELHKHPETAWQETRTANYIRNHLTSLDIAWRECTVTGTLATLNNTKATQKHIALRADIDALPIVEQNHTAYKSTTSGCMHACGHDGHSATLLGVAAWLKKFEHSLPHKITLIFQPAEEGGHGAKKMIEQGALDGVDEIYGWHNWPALNFCQLFCPDGLVMSGNGEFRIFVKGQGGHSSQPELCRDPVLAASAIHLALQNIVSRRLQPQTPAVVSVTSINAPSELTVIPSHAQLSGSIRFADEQTRDIINQLIHEISLNTAHAYGVECDVQISPRYHATINHSPQAQFARDRWQDLFSPQALTNPTTPPVMASEDFSYYLREIPGAFSLIGANETSTPIPPCHNPHYDFNDKLIDKVAQFFCSIAGAPLPTRRPSTGDHYDNIR